MKLLWAGLFFLMASSAWACPQLSGSFYDADADSVRKITQDRCVSTTWTDEESQTILLADNVERVLETDGKMTAYAKVSFTDEDLVIDIRMDWGGSNDFDLPVRWITSYRIDKYKNLVEKIRPFKEDGSELGTEYITFRRVK